MTDISTLIAEVQRLDGERQRLIVAAMGSPTAANQHAEVTARAADAAPILAAEVERLRAEVASLRQGWRAERDAALRVHDLLIAEREAARLTLAAEQGRQEGAPVGWQWDITLGCWRRGQWGVNAVIVDRLGDADDGWGWRLPSERHQNTAPHGIWTARAAMQAADTAQEPR